MKTLSIDIETYSSVSLVDSGVYKYAEGDDFKVLLFAYSFNDEDAKVISIAEGERLPNDVLEALVDPNVQKWAYNAQFERVCLSKHLRLNGFLDPSQWYCTMAFASMLGLPGSLDKVSEVLGLSEKKMREGKLLINYFSVPCKPTKSNGNRIRNLPQHDIDKWNLFKSYNAQDVRTERAIYNYCMKVAGMFDPREHDIYAMDQAMNDAGVLVDRQLVYSVLAYNDTYVLKLYQRAQHLTGLDNPNSVNQLKGWMESKGLPSNTLNKEDVSEFLNSPNITDEVREVLTIRQELSKSSVKKYTAMANCMCHDSRIHGMLQYYGANRTGRWSGRLVQLQNLKRNSYKEIDAIRSLVRSGHIADVELIYDGIAEPFSQLVRTAFIAPPGETLCIADYSAIEARVIAWLADEKWVMDVFATTGKIYENTASKMFGVPVEHIEHGSPLRAKGKIATLALGYGGAVGALTAMGAVKMGLSDEELPDIVNRWRRANPHIVKLWSDVENGVRQVLSNGGRVKLHHGVYFSFDGRFLKIGLPAGRELSYYSAFDDDEGIGYMSKNQTSGKWERVRTFGGKLVENIVQAIARDCLADAMLRLEDAGYRIAFHVHDEVIVEGQEDQLGIIMAIMGQSLSWAPNLLLTAAGYCSPYYLKD